MSALTRKLLPALIASIATVLPLAAPQAATEAPTIRITYQDLNLATSAGVEVLYRRVLQAASDYCEATRALTGTRVSVAFNRCVKDAVATTVKTIDHPGLSAMHAAHGGVASTG